LLSPHYQKSGYLEQYPTLQSFLKEILPEGGGLSVTGP
jgi:hypothetical protein